MSHITPVSPGSSGPEPSDFVPADGPDDGTSEALTQPRDRQLWLLILIPVIYGIFTLGAWSANHAPQPPPTGPYENTAPVRVSKILVHVAGAVQRPGVYELPGGARVNDAVKRALPLQGADVNALNLAAWAEDGSRIEVPFQKKDNETPREPLITLAPLPGESRKSPQSTAQPAAKSLAKPTAKPMSSQAPAKTSPSAALRKININRASLDDLTLLPGVGPSLAERIIDYRKANGAFISVDALDNVKGVGPKKLEMIRPWATVR